ncbi:MAG: hypothetical protein Tsb0013_19730 [Phycisphaerales bacterium]
MKLHEADPSDADVAYMIAQEQAKAGAYEGALAWYDRCLEQDASYHYAYYHKARAQQAMEDIDGARETLRAGLGVATRDTNAKAMSEISSFLGELGG